MKRQRTFVDRALLTLISSSPDRVSGAYNINFDPMLMADGIEPTNDPVLRFRSSSYAIYPPDARLAADLGWLVVVTIASSKKHRSVHQGCTCDKSGSVDIGRRVLDSRAAAAIAGSGIRMGGTAW